MAVFKRRPKRKGKGAIALIVTMFVASAIMRLWIGPGPAVAEAVSEVAGKSKAMSETEAMPPQATAASGMPQEEVSALLTALREREERVKLREQQLDARSKALTVANDEITKRLAMLTETEERLRQTLALADGAAENDIARLTAVYENMKPKDAAALFETMEPDFSAGFLGRMRPDAAAAVMAGLSPEVAYSISVILAGRNANAPKS